MIKEPKVLVFNLNCCMKRCPLVSIVILNFNGKNFLERCLSSVLNTRYSNFEVIFVDNASTDGSVEYVKEKFNNNPTLKIIVNDQNYGPSQGNNIGSVHARGKYVVFLNNDIEVDPIWLKELVGVMESDPTIGVAGCKQLLWDSPNKIDTLGADIDCLGFVYSRGFSELDKGQYNKRQRVFAVGTTALIMRVELFRKIWMLDQDFFMCYEDVDLCWRVHLSGYYVVSVPSAVVYHAVCGTTRKISKPLRVFYTERNRMSSIIKNYTLFSLVRYAPLLILFQIVQAAFYLFREKPHHTIGIAKALLWVLLNFRVVWSKHEMVQRKIRNVKVKDVHVRKIMKRIDIKDLWTRSKFLYA